MAMEGAGAASTGGAGAPPRSRPVLWPAFVTIAAFLAVVAQICREALHLTNGTWIYSLDDTYIHMAIARSFATHGVWGVTPDGFTSSTSSPLWSLLIAAAFKLVGVQMLVPFVLALAFAIAAILQLNRLVSASGAPGPWVLIVLLVSVFAAPMPTLAYSGMEHLMHIVVMLLVLEAGLRALGPEPGRRDALVLAAGGALLTMSRFEGLFQIAILGLMLAARGRWGVAIATVAGGIAPVALYGAWSRAHGWYWLPNSVLLKGRALHGPLKAWIKGLINNGYNQTWANPHVLVVLLGALVLLMIPRKSAAGRANRDALVIFTVVMVLHMQFAVVGWFYRYEAYLIAIGVALIGSGIWIERERLRSWLLEPPRLPRLAAATVIAILMARPLLERAQRSARETPRAAANIYGQQYQMARFLNRYYGGQAVMVNDIGAVSWFGNEHLLDIWGLASLEPARLSLTHQWSLDQARRLVRESGAKVAIVYEIWFRQFGGTPAEWTRVGVWKIPKNVTCAFDSVSIFALTPEETLPLARHVKEFEPELPYEAMHLGPDREIPGLWVREGAPRPREAATIGGP